MRAGTFLKGGAYQVQGHLSRGGMGAVYLARDMHAFGRPCVIKEMLDYYDSADPDARTKAEARFREEERILAMLGAPEHDIGAEQRRDLCGHWRATEKLASQLKKEAGITRRCFVREWDASLLPPDR